MTVTLTWHEDHLGGRIVGRLGGVEVGAVFPGDPARWRFWLGGGAYSPEGKARSELAAKNKLLENTANWLRKAGLKQREPTK